MLYKGGEESLGGIFTYGIWDVSACSSRTKGAMDKRRSQFDLARQIGLETPLEASLMVGDAAQRGEECGRNFLTSDFGDILTTTATTNGSMDKWMSELDSADQKGPEITLKGILTIVKAALRRENCCSFLCFTHILQIAQS